MAVKSVIGIGLEGDESFKDFAELFDKYQQQLSKTPAAWADASKEAKASYSTFSQIAAALMAQNALTKKKTDAERESNESLRKQSGYWDRMVRGSRELASNVAGITKDIVRWASLGSVFTGLIGGGTLFGLDRLADSVGSGRRAALGLNTTYGERQAFQLNYGRVVEPGSFLSGVQEALQDVTKRQSLYAAGLTERDLAGKDTAQVAAELLPRLKALADQTPPGLLEQVIQARGLSQFVSLQDMQRLQNTPASELNEYSKSYARDRVALGLDAKGQKVWQDFSVQMTRAGSKIENVFVRGLEPLIGPLNHLSDSVVRAIESFLSSKKLADWINEAGRGIEWFAKEVGSGDFQKKIATFIDDVGTIISTAANFARWLSGDGAKKEGPGNRFNDQPLVQKGGWFDRNLNPFYQPAAAGPTANNLINLRPVGASTGYRTFPTLDAGIRAGAADLRYKENKHGLDTIEKLVERFANGPGDNPAAYIADVSKTTGFGPMQHINLNDNRTLASVLSAFSKHEKGVKHRTSPEVILKVLNESGGNVIAQTNQNAGYVTTINPAATIRTK